MRDRTQLIINLSLPGCEQTSHSSPTSSLIVRTLHLDVRLAHFEPYWSRIYYCDSYTLESLAASDTTLHLTLLHSGCELTSHSSLYLSSIVRTLPLVECITHSESYWIGNLHRDRSSLDAPSNAIATQLTPTTDRVSINLHGQHYSPITRDGTLPSLSGHLSISPLTAPVCARVGPDPRARTGPIGTTRRVICIDHSMMDTGDLIYIEWEQTAIDSSCSFESIPLYLSLEASVVMREGPDPCARTGPIGSTQRTSHTNHFVSSAGGLPRLQLCAA